MFGGSLQDGGHVVGKPELVQCLDDMIARNRLFGLLLGNLIRLGTNESDELHAAFNKNIASLLGKRDAGRPGEDLTDYLLDRSLYNVSN
jgi:hypothetical protein